MCMKLCDKTKKSSNKNSSLPLLAKRKNSNKPKSMADEFNKFFTCIGNDLQTKIPTTKKILRLFEVAKLKKKTIYIP